MISARMASHVAGCFDQCDGRSLSSLSSIPLFDGAPGKIAINAKNGLNSDPAPRGRCDCNQSTMAGALW